MGQMTGLKQQVSSYFGIPSGTKVILQRFDKEWDTYLDLDKGDTFHDLMIMINSRSSLYLNLPQPSRNQIAAQKVNWIILN